MTAKLIVLVAAVIAAVSAHGTSHTSVAKAGESQFVYDIVHDNPGQWSGTAFPHGYGGLGVAEGGVAGAGIAGVPGAAAVPGVPAVAGVSDGTYSYSGLTGYGANYGNRYGYGSYGYPYAHHNYAHNAIPYGHNNLMYSYGHNYNALPYSGHGAINYGSYGSALPYSYGGYGTGYGATHSYSAPYGMHGGYGALNYGSYGHGYNKLMSGAYGHQNVWY